MANIVLISTNQIVDLQYISDNGDLIIKIVGNESGHSIIQPELEPCTEEECRVIQTRNAISSYLEKKCFLYKFKETNQLSIHIVSLNNSLSKLKTPSQIESKGLLTNQTLKTKMKNKSCHRSIFYKSPSKNHHQNHHLHHGTLTKFLRDLKLLSWQRFQQYKLKNAQNVRQNFWKNCMRSKKKNIQEKSLKSTMNLYQQKQNINLMKILHHGIQQIVSNNR